MPTRLQNGEGRTDGEAIDRSTRPIRRGSWARHAGKVMRVTGETRPVGGRGFTVAMWRRIGRESDRGTVLLNPGNAGGGKAPDFWYAFEDGEEG
jgi:hypothetical protein